MTVERNAVFAVGSGRRYIRRFAALGGVGQVIAPSTNPPRWKSAPWGIGRSMRMLPNWRSCVELATGLGFATPGGRQSDPSNTKIGSLDSFFWTSPGVMVHPWFSAWHVPHSRPLVPNLWKNGRFPSSNLKSFTDAVSDVPNVSVVG